MIGMMIYLDNNATTQPADEVVEAATRAQRELWANPSSVHRFGQRTRQAIELARSEVCALIGCRERELVFTSGATEANNFALRGIAAVRGERRVIVTTPTEHAAVREPCEQMQRDDYEVVQLPVDGSGLASPDDLAGLLRERGGEIALVSVHWANNETGVIQPIERLAELCRAHRIPFHTDASQMVGKVPVDVKAAGVDALSFSGHKFHGPKGIGGLFVRSSLRLRPLVTGGPHERQRRGGTEAVAAIVGLGEAAKLARHFVESDDRTRGQALRDRFEQTICRMVDQAGVNAADAPRLWNTSNIAFRGLEAEAILLLLSERDVCASAGAACSSGSLEPSPVLLAMGLDEPVAHGSVRFSLSRFTAEDEIDQALVVIPQVIEKLRSTMPVG